MYVFDSVDPKNNHGGCFARVKFRKRGNEIKTSQPGRNKWQKNGKNLSKIKLANVTNINGDLVSFFLSIWAVSMEMANE